MTKTGCRHAFGAADVKDAEGNINADMPGFHLKIWFMEL